MSEAEQKKHALIEITDILERERPIIIHDAHESDDYILMLKGMTEATLDMDSEDTQKTGDAAANYLKTVTPVLQFLYDHGCLSAEFDMHSLHIDERYITGLSVPDGEKAFNALELTYNKYGIDNPFGMMTTGSDVGLVETLLDEQRVGEGNML